MSNQDIEKIFFEACDSFIKNIDKYNWSLFYESDFRSAIYAELIKSMDKKQLNNYPICTEYRYGGNRADIALGYGQEIAVEIKFTYTDHPISRYKFNKTKNQLIAYIKNGAKKAYLLYLEHQNYPDKLPLSKVIDIQKLGLSGEWKEINGEEIAGDQLLIATITK